MNPPIDRRKFLQAGAALGALGGAGLLGACSPSGSAAPSGKEFSGITLTFWVLDMSRQQAVTDLCETFTQQTGARVNVQLVTFAQATSTKFATAFQAGTSADVSEAYPPSASTFFEKGYLVEMSDLIEKIGKQNIVESALPMVSWKGKYTSVPWFMQPRVLFYRKDWFAEAGLAPEPKTWADIATAARALTNGRRYGIALPYQQHISTGQAYLTWFLNSEPSKALDIIDKDGASAVNSLYRSQSVEALDTYTSYFKDGLVPPSATTSSFQTNDITNMFATEQTGMVLTPSTILNQFQKSNPKLLDPNVVGAVTVPTKTGEPGNSYLGGSPLWISTQSKHPEAARALVEFLIQKDSLATFFKTSGGNLPAYKDSLADPAISGAPFIKPFIDQLPRAKFWFWSRGADPAITALNGNNFDNKPVTSVVSLDAPVANAVSDYGTNVSSVL